jgi:hypothetical protein
MLQLARRRWLLIVLAALAAACSTQPVARTTIDRVLKAPAVPNAPYSNLVLVGIAPSREIARELEQGLGDELARDGVQVHSFVKESSAVEASADAVQALVRATGADGVLMITGRLSGTDLTERQGSVEGEARSIGGNLVNFFRYDYEEFTEPTYADITLNITLVALLFDAATNERVHSVESSTSNAETAYQIVTAQGKAIAERLKKDGMIR